MVLNRQQDVAYFTTVGIEKSFGEVSAASVASFSIGYYITNDVIAFDTVHRHWQTDALPATVFNQMSALLAYAVLNLLINE